MKKNIFLVLVSVFSLCACDDVDITRYSGYVQSCYHDIIDSPDNCTTKKRTVVKYCRCREKADVLVDQKRDEMKYNAQSHLQFSSGFGFIGMLAQMDYVAQMRQELQEYTQKLYDNCAKDTGYTRFANCPKKEQPTE